jgi:hypothetical protein
VDEAGATDATIAPLSTCAFCIASPFNLVRAFHFDGAAEAGRFVMSIFGSTPIA